MNIIDLCSAGLLCMELATHRVTLSRGERKAPPIATCDRHLSEMVTKAQAAGVNIEIKPVMAGKPPAGAAT